MSQTFVPGVFIAGAASTLVIFADTSLSGIIVSIVLSVVIGVLLAALWTYSPLPNDSIPGSDAGAGYWGLSRGGRE